MLPSGIKEAIGYWERRRLAYNAVLAMVVLLWVFVSWPHFRPAMTLQSLLALSALAATANGLYCAAYLVDLGVQCASGEVTRKRLRTAVFIAGTLFAILLTNYWIADEIYPYVG